MALEGEELLAGRAVPDLHRLVLLAEARRWPSGLNATLVTQPAWPLRANSSLPVALSQIFTVWSPLADARRWPSGLNATLVTAPAWPLRAKSSLPVALSQIFTVWSSLPEARRWPSGLNATLLTPPAWPLRAKSSLPVALSQIFTVLSIARRRQALAVRAERHAPDPTGMALEGEQLLAGRAVPDLHRLVIARRRQALAVRAERHAPSDRSNPGMALEGEQLLAGRAVPDLHRLVMAPRRQALAVRAERHARDRAGMAYEGQLIGMAQAGQVEPLEPTQVSAGRLAGYLCEQFAGADDIILFPGTLGQPHPGRIRGETSLVALLSASVFASRACLFRHRRRVARLALELGALGDLSADVARTACQVLTTTPATRRMANAAAVTSAVRCLRANLRSR